MANGYKIITFTVVFCFRPFFENYLIEIVQGLGDKLVKGEVTPITLTGTFGALTSCTSYPWLTELLLVVSRLKEISGHHVDVEFAVDLYEELWILQQRPVTELTENRVLDLTGYKKQYKRSMCTLDIELLIDGCTRHLAPYLEVDVDLSRWMVMVRELSRLRLV